MLVSLLVLVSLGVGEWWWVILGVVSGNGYISFKDTAFSF